MRFLLQRVSAASVQVDQQRIAAIGPGLLVLIGIAAQDTRAEADYLADRLVNLRVFSDDAGKMNRSALDVRAELLLISQFTLYADCRRGRRPGFDKAAPPALARELYDYVVEVVTAQGLVTRTGTFQAHMQVELINDGPVTLLLES